MLPLLSRIASALGNWLGEASFLTDEEKRTATGYAPLPAASAPSLKFNADQPRVPGGSPDGGQWMSGGEGGAAPDSEELLPENAAPVQGHHYEPNAVVKKFPFSEEAQKVFNADRTGPLKAQKHGWSSSHGEYNDAVEEHFKRFFRENRIKPEEMTSDQARKLSNQIKSSRDPRIRNFNMRIWRREIIRLIRRR